MFIWQVPGRKNHSAQWYMIAGIFCVSLAIWGVFTQIYALTVVVILLAGVYIMLENNAADSVEAIINENGIGIGEGFYDYGQIEDFAFLFEGKTAQSIRIRLRKNSLRTIDIPLLDMPVDELRAYLLGYLPEGAGVELSFIDRMIEKAGL